jgi:hypothetical protein
MSSRGRFATYADSPLHDGSPYRGLDVRRESVGVVSRSRGVLCRAVAKPERERWRVELPLGHLASRADPHNAAEEGGVHAC